MVKLDHLSPRLKRPKRRLAYSSPTHVRSCDYSPSPLPQELQRPIQPPNSPARQSSSPTRAKSFGKEQTMSVSTQRFNVTVYHNLHHQSISRGSLVQKSHPRLRCSFQRHHQDLSVCPSHVHRISPNQHPAVPKASKDVPTDDRFC